MKTKTNLRAGLSAFFLLLFSQINLTAQHNSLFRNAFGLRFVDTQHFSVFYKKQIEADRFRRINLAFFRLDFNKEGDYNAYQWNLGFNSGKLRHVPLHQDFDFYHGLEYSFSTSARALDLRQNHFSLGLGLGYVLGVEYSIKHEYGIGLEIAPHLGISYAKQSGRVAQWRIFSSGNFANVAVNFQYYFSVVN